MRSKVLVVLALPLLYFGGLIAGGTVKASSGVQPLRVAYTRFAFLTPTTMGTWESVASVAVTAKKDNGSVHVAASGMSSMPAGIELTLTLATAPAARGPWVFSYGSATGTASSFENFNVEMVFGDVPGPNITSSYFLNATFFAGAGGADIQLGSMTATAMQRPVTEDCDPGVPFTKDERPGGNFGAGNLDPKD